MSVLVELSLNLLGWAILAALAFPAALVLWRTLPSPRRLLRHQRTRAIPWGGWEVAAVFFLCLLFWPSLARSLLDPSQTPAQRMLWMSVIAFPFQIATIFVLLGLLCNARPYQFGFSRGTIIRQILPGSLCWFLLTPCVLVLYAGAFWACLKISGLPPVHPLARLAQESQHFFEKLAIVLAAAVLAPILEELLFRGVLQPWLAKRSWGGHIAMGFALLLASASAYTEVTDRGGSLVISLMPVFFVLAMVPAYLTTQRWARRWFPSLETARAVFGTALLFGMLHVDVWPTPVPLFLLGYGLGYAAYRTQGVVAPIVMHALFNAVAFVALLLSQGMGATEPANGKDATSALQRPPSVSTSNAVPGSWLPRRTYASAIPAPIRGETTDDVAWPISLSSREILAPAGTAEGIESRRPTSDRLTCP